MKQNINEDFNKINEKKLIPVLHVASDHSLCDNEWYLALKAKEASKIYQHKTVFDMTKRHQHVQ